MSSPFPGMDPYLEAPDLWRGIHTRLVTYVADALQPQLLPRYAALVEDRVLLGPPGHRRWPDVSVEEQPGRRGGAAVAVRPSRLEVTIPDFIEAPELALPPRFIAVRDLSDRRLVTAIEILSPWNKSGKGLTDYRQKQREYLHSAVNLVEIDLLRAGRHAVAAPRELMRRSDYRVCIHAAGSSGFGVIPFGVHDPLPVVGIPLEDEDPDIALDLPSVFSGLYVRGAFAYLVDYSRDPDPPLPSEDRDWARERIRSRQASADAESSPAV